MNATQELLDRTRDLTGAERRRAADSDLDERLADRIEIGTREQQVLSLLQTPRHPPAS